MIELKNVSKVFTTKKGNVEALKSTSLQVKKKGEVFGIIGYSGAGKSTLIRCVNLLEKTNDRKYYCKRARFNNTVYKRTSKARQKNRDDFSRIQFT